MTMLPKIRTFAQFLGAIVIDGASIEVRIKRLTNIEWDEFRTGYALATKERGAETESADVAAARSAMADEWLRAVLARFVQITPGQIEHEGRDVTDASELIDIYGGRSDVVPQLLALIIGENTLGEAQKKIFKSALASQHGSPTEPQPTVSGGGPERTAGSVAPKDSVSAAGATEYPSAASSGMTDRLSSRPVRSARSRRT